MGTLRSALEFQFPSTGEFVSRFECRWKYEPLSEERLVFTSELSQGVRNTLLGELTRAQNGRRVEPYSHEENELLTYALRQRFAAWKAHADEIRAVDLESDHDDFQWQQARLDEIERIMQGYVNLIFSVNFDESTFIDATNFDRVEDFLADYEDAIVTAFENQGGAQAFFEKTPGIKAFEKFGDRIFRTLQTSDLGFEPGLA